MSSRRPQFRRHQVSEATSIFNREFKNSGCKNSPCSRGRRGFHTASLFAANTRGGGFLSRCSRSLNATAGGRSARPEEGRKISFCMRIAEPQETSIHSLLGSPARMYTPLSMCMYARLILRFSRKTSDRVSLDQWRWKHGARGVNYT